MPVPSVPPFVPPTISDTPSDTMCRTDNTRHATSTWLWMAGKSKQVSGLQEGRLVWHTPQRQ
jgi:hypothetical protein